MQARTGRRTAALCIGLLGLLLAGLVGCADVGPSRAPERTPEASQRTRTLAAPPAPRTRPFYLASTGVQAHVRHPSGLPYVLDTGNLATDVDAISVHNDFYGIPWSAFQKNAPPPVEWEAVMNRLAAHAASARKPVFLSLQLSRKTLADDVAVANGQFKLIPGPSCYDFSTAPDAAARRQAYLGYVEYMVKKFRPRWVNVALEVNFFQEHCSDRAWRALAAVASAAYDRVKSIDPNAVVFPSFSLFSLYKRCMNAPENSREACLKTTYGTLSGFKRDRFAIADYPFLGRPADVDPYAIEDWYFNYLPSLGGERIVFAETGWPSTPVVAETGGQCNRVTDSSEAKQIAYFNRLVDFSTAHGVDLIAWWSNRDLMPSRVVTECPCRFNAEWCGKAEQNRSLVGSDVAARTMADTLFKSYSTMGLRAYDGAPKGAFYRRWQEVRSLPITP